MTDERKELFLKTIFTNEDTARAALTLTAEQVQARLAAAGQCFTLEEVRALGAALNATTKSLQTVLQQNESDLTPKMLEDATCGAGDAEIELCSWVLGATGTHGATQDEPITFFAW